MLEDHSFPPLKISFPESSLLSFKKSSDWPGIKNKRLKYPSFQGKKHAFLSVPLFVLWCLTPDFNPDLQKSWEDVRLGPNIRSPFEHCQLWIFFLRCIVIISTSPTSLFKLVLPVPLLAPEVLFSYTPHKVNLGLYFHKQKKWNKINAMCIFQAILSWMKP